jgi:hypothetical protein
MLVNHIFYVASATPIFARRRRSMEQKKAEDESDDKQDSPFRLLVFRKANIFPFHVAERKISRSLSISLGTSWWHSIASER